MLAAAVTSPKQGRRLARHLGSQVRDAQALAGRCLRDVVLCFALGRFMASAARETSSRPVGVVRLTEPSKLGPRRAVWQGSVSSPAHVHVLPSMAGTV